MFRRRFRSSATFPRRSFLKASMGLAASATLPKWLPTAAAAALPPPPAHRAISMSGIHAYALENSLERGGVLQLAVSADRNYDWQIRRLGTNPDDPQTDQVIASGLITNPSVQPIRPGSYIHVGAGFVGNLPQLTLECWVRPAATNLWMGLITQHDYPAACGYGLFLNPWGGVSFYLGDGAVYRGNCSLDVIPPNGTTYLSVGRWHHVAATWDGNVRRIYIDGVYRGGAVGQAVTPAAGPTPLRLAAYGNNGVADQFLEGDLAMPVIHQKALTSTEILARFQNRGQSVPTTAQVFAAWPMTEENGVIVSDALGLRPGRIINHATWMIGGPNFDADIGPFTDPFRGRCLRLFAGSYLQAPSLGTGTFFALSLEAWVRIPRNDRFVGIVTQHDYPNHCGFGLFLEFDAIVSFNTGNGGPWTNNPLRSPSGTLEPGYWYHLVGVWHNGHRELWVNGRRVAQDDPGGVLNGGRAPLLLGAYASNGVIGNFFEGHMAQVAAYNRPLYEAEIQARYADLAQTAPTGVLAAWTLSQVSGTTAAEITGQFPAQLLHPGLASSLPQTPAGAIGRSRKLHPGDYFGATRITTINSLTLEIWIRPQKVDAWTGLLTQHDYPSRCGYGLFITPQAGISFYLGTGGTWQPTQLDSLPGILSPHRWYHVVGVWDGTNRSRRLYLNGQLVASSAGLSITVAGGTAPIMLGGYRHNNVPGQFFTGDMGQAVIYNRALSTAEVIARYQNNGQSNPSLNGVQAAWMMTATGASEADLMNLRTATLRLASTTTQLGRWAQARPVNDFFTDYAPNLDPSRGHGIRFTGDDLYDCGWGATLTYPIPANAEPGLYAARLSYPSNGQTLEYYVPFIVRRTAAEPRARILVLANENTWRAYNATPFAGAWPVGAEDHYSTPGRRDATGNTVLPNPAHPDVPEFSLYRAHKTRSAINLPSYQVGRRIPCPAASPRCTYGAQSGYSHLLRQELYTHGFLRENGYNYDVITDVDLHRDPSRLLGYSAVILAGHAEYWSAEMYHGLESYLASGGNVLSLSANQIWWRVSFDANETVMECRKTGWVRGGTANDLQWGEAWHSQDFARGGLLRECGMPGMALLGLEFVAWINPTPAQFRPYRVRLANHPFWAGTGVANGSTVANTMALKGSGHEYDIPYSAFLTPLVTRPVPSPPPAGPNPTSFYSGVTVLAESDPMSPGLAMDLQTRPFGTSRGAHIIDWQRPTGGRVVNCGSVNAGYAVYYDPLLRRFIGNVLTAFGV